MSRACAKAADSPEGLALDLQIAFWFAATIALVWFVLSLVVWTLVTWTSLGQDLQLLTARSVGAVCRWSGLELTVSGIVFEAPAHRSYCALTCTGLDTWCLVVALYAATRPRLRHVLAGLLLITAGTFAVNLLRIVTMIWAGQTSDELSWWIHYAWLQIISPVLVFVGVGLCWHWVRRGCAYRSAPAPLSPQPLENAS
jgi:exosortase/archaeosortase family protein